jgi:hypothetical protein
MPRSIASTAFSGELPGRRLHRPTDREPTHSEAAFELDQDEREAADELCTPTGYELARESDSVLVTIGNERAIEVSAAGCGVIPTPGTE